MNNTVAGKMGGVYLSSAGGLAGDKASGSARGTSIILFIVVKLNPILTRSHTHTHTFSEYAQETRGKNLLIF